MNAVEQINASQKAKIRKWILIAILAFVLLMGGMILPFFINPKAFYDIKDGKVYFGNKELTHMNAKEFKTIDYTIAVDCTRVYYKGEPVNFMDRKTFKDLSRGFYADKNGLYFEKTSFYSKHKIVPLEGSYDKASFHSLGYQTTLFADKSNLYALDVFAESPLKKVTMDGMDMTTLESVSSYWLQDKARIYFEDFGEIKVCPEIDATTFEVLSYRVVKDKKRVYYITQGLKTEEKNATERADYAVLEGADAATFVMINEKEYRDKNQEWVISKEGEKVEYNVPEGRKTNATNPSKNEQNNAAEQALKAAEQAAGK
ncbi:DKNYY domain-containing protein [Sphingobacterium sp. SRCM116780]|uniref:DKNYY domain-containing protein n=1 Tax=Sphingobacterium sp. SRCM116780 TaxID=2907623 RepID=UPI001F3418C9|nr:DKNYY domain-containing protein [Sphingobacterium sp. SRCM116780]UIR57346.1 DKNYY domain-containing protein [Sphingobacterium sp. SRCM116780]